MALDVPKIALSQNISSSRIDFLGELVTPHDASYRIDGAVQHHFLEEVDKVLPRLADHLSEILQRALISRELVPMDPLTAGKIRAPHPAMRVAAVPESMHPLNGAHKYLAATGDFMLYLSGDADRYFNTGVRSAGIPSSRRGQIDLGKLCYLTAADLAERVGDEPRAELCDELCHHFELLSDAITGIAEKLRLDSTRFVKNRGLEL